jgi:RNA-directed DNA polymerase
MVRSKQHLERVLKYSWKELQRLALSVDQYYYKKIEIKKHDNGDPKLDGKGNPKLRILYPSKGRLKEVQARIKNTILKKIPWPDYVYGGVKGKDNVRNAKVHQGKKYKFCTDLKDFFPSVNPKMVYNGLVDQGFSADVAGMLTKLTTYKGQVPQGAPTSTHIANVAFLETDAKISKLCEQSNITYTRFVDDLAFSSQDAFKELTFDIIAIILSDFYKISHRKTMYAEGSIPITGAWVKNNGLGITDALKEKLQTPEKYKPDQVKGHQNYAKRVKSI